MRLPILLSALGTLTMTLDYLRAQEAAINPERIANTIILDKVGVQNLKIQTVEVDEREFESTVFAIGRIEEIPARRSVLSSRIPGRAVKVYAFEGDLVTEGQLLVEVESRQYSENPPIIPLNAPRTGVVIASHVRVGQPVEPETELLDVTDRSMMWAIARIPEQEAASFGIGAKARIVVPALASTPIVAILARYGVAADRQAGTVEGIFELENNRGKLRPGMRAEFSIITGRRTDVLSVPRAAIQGDPAKRVVYVKDFELPHAFVRAPVVLGERNDRYVEIESGLFPGDEVVTQGSYSLGFAGGGSISLKEALDAAHGHEHNEDGSEITPEQKAQRESESGHIHRESKAPPYLTGYAIVVTLLFLVAAQAAWRSRKGIVSDAE